jgi:hypothetical protein
VRVQVLGCVPGVSFLFVLVVVVGNSLDKSSKLLKNLAVE